MFFFLSKIITFLLDPFLYIILIAFIATISSHFRRSIKGLLFVFLCILVFGSTNYFAELTLSSLEKIQTNKQQHQHYDAVIVLSGMLNLDNSKSGQLEFSSAVDRILKGIALVNENKADYLIISGGDGGLISSGLSEAVLLGDFATKMGIDPAKVIIEATSKNTHQNAVETAKIVKKRGFQKLLLVTSAFHMHRAIGCFQQQDLFPDHFSVDFYTTTQSKHDFRYYLPSSQGLIKLTRFIHETTGIIAYYLTNKAKW